MSDTAPDDPATTVRTVPTPEGTITVTVHVNTGGLVAGETGTVADSDEWRAVIAAGLATLER